MLWPKKVPVDLAYGVHPQLVEHLLGPIDGDIITLRQSPDGRRAIVRTIYDALLSHKVRYDTEPFSTDDRIQKIREPNEILSGSKVGTCVDLTLTFAGACIAYELIPIIVLMHDHAFLTVCLENQLKEFDSPRRRNYQTLQDEVLTDKTILEELISSGGFIPIECTGVAHTDILPPGLPEGLNRKNGILTFDDAVIAGKAQLSTNRNFRCCLDVSIALFGWGMGECHLVPAREAGTMLHFTKTPSDSRQLVTAWFKHQVAREIEIIGDKFNPDLHVESIAELFKRFVLGHKEFAERIESDLNYLLERSEIFESDRRELSFPNEPCEHHKILSNRNNELQTALESLVTTYTKDLTDLCNKYLQGQLDITTDFSLEPEVLLIGDQMTELYKNASTILKDKDCSKVCREAAFSAKRYAELVESIYKEQRLLEGLLLSIRSTELHIIGPAHSGKTHFAAQAAMEQLNLGAPAILIRGIEFVKTKTIQENILEILGLADSFTWTGFLNALNNAAHQAETRVPIIIDGIHESESVSIWADGLTGLIEDLAQFKKLVLITTCRDEYEESIWKKYAGNKRIQLRGFEPNKVISAIERYFEYYKIKPLNITLPIAYFSDPIILRIFCESVNHDREVEVSIDIKPLSLFTVFEDYLGMLNSNVCKRLGQTPFINISRNKLTAFAKTLWTSNRRSLPFTQARELFDGTTDGDWKQSMLRTLIDEDILTRIVSQRDDVIVFTYDLMAGYLIAESLIADHSVQSLINDHSFQQKLLGDEHNLHPLHEDILRAIGSLLPHRRGRHLFEFINNLKTKRAHIAIVQALYEIDPTNFPQEAFDFIRSNWFVDTLRKPLLGVGRQFISATDHPLNFDFWNLFLHSLSTTDRDCTWSEYLRQHNVLIEPFLVQLEEVLLETTSPLLDDRRHERYLEYICKFLMWILCSSSHPLRDKATFLLFLLGLQFPSCLFDLTLNSVEINDLYVPERMLAAAFGVVMRKNQDEDFNKLILPSFARTVYEKVFGPNRVISTTHFLLREYSRQIIECAIHRSALSPEDLDVAKCRPPFKGTKKLSWRRITKEQLCGTSECAGPIHMDFQHYTMSSLHGDRPEIEATEKLYWRMKKLGYDYNRFEQIDKTLQSWRTAEEGGKIDRYGKKYSRIAYCELMGHEIDCRRLRKYEEDRHFLPDIDPSFPSLDISSPEWNIKNYVATEPNLSCRDWVRKKDAVDITEILWTDNFFSVEDPSILLLGSVYQEDVQLQRGFFVYCIPVCIKSSDHESFLTRVLECDFFSQPFREAPEDYYTFMGEIPWASSFPPNEAFRWSLDASERKRDDDIEVLTVPPFFRPLSKKVRASQQCTALVPVRENHWESGRTLMNDARREIILCRELFEELDLRFNVDSLSAESKGGQRVTVRVSKGKAWHAAEHALFIQKSFLDEFLSNSGYKLAWLVRGLRQTTIKDMQVDPRHLPEERFQGICLYEDLLSGKSQD